MKMIKYFFALNFMCTSVVLAAHCPTVTPKDISDIVKPLALKNEAIPEIYHYRDSTGKVWNLKDLIDLVSGYQHEAFSVEKVTSVSEDIQPHRRLPGVRVIKCIYELQLSSTEQRARVDRIELNRIDTTEE